jgi:hypothetical protein
MVGTGRFELPRLGFASHPRRLLSIASAARMLWIGTLAAGSS